MGFLDKFRKSDELADSEDFPEISSMQKQPSLGPAAFAPPPTSDPMTSSAPTSFSSQNEMAGIQMLQGKLDMMISKIDGIKIELSALSQRIFRIEQILSSQRSGQPQSPISPYGGSSPQSYESSYGQQQSQPQPEQSKEDQNVWPF